MAGPPLFACMSLTIGKNPSEFKRINLHMHMHILQNSKMDACGGQRSHALDGLRGLAALAVIFYHCLLLDPRLPRNVLPVPIQDLTHPGDIIAKFALALFSGSLAVLLFFVLSGFVLKLSFDRMQGSPATVAYNFVVRRLCRLFPVLIFALALCHGLALLWISAGLPGSGRHFFIIAADPWAVLQNALLWQTRAHGATWTLQAELIVIPFLLAALFISRISAAAALGCFAYALLAMKASFLVAGTQWMSPFLAAFIAGMVAADARFRTVFLGLGQRMLVLLLVMLVAVKLFLPERGFSVSFLNVALSMMLVGGVYHAALSTPFVRALNSRPSQFLGRISYSLYLINVPLIWVVLALSPAMGLDRLDATSRGLLMGLAVTLLSLPAAVFSERVVERGGIRLGRMLSIEPDRAQRAVAESDGVALSRAI